MRFTILLPWSSEHGEKPESLATGLSIVNVPETSKPHKNRVGKSELRRFRVGFDPIDHHDAKVTDIGVGWPCVEQAIRRFEEGKSVVLF